MVSSILKLVLLAASTLQGAYAAQNQLQQVTGNIGSNPNNVGMYVYKPSKLASPTPLIVAIHYCTGSAQAYFSGTQYANLADQHGFIVVYPSSPRSGGCFDVNTNGTLTHNGGGDSQGIASMVNYAISNYGVDASKVFVTGSSSGAMMTNVMCGSYPNLFAASSIYSGVPYACFAGASDWNSACANGQVSETAARWGDLVRNGYPGYSGARPKMMIWHGTADNILYYPNFAEEIKQWTNVLGDSQTAATTAQNNPSSGYTQTTYGSASNPNVIAYSGQGVGHTVPVHETIDLAWFGISGSVSIPGGGGGGGSTTTTTTTTSGGSGPTGGGSVAHWGQCGGIGYTGATGCQSPYTCTVINPYYSQCL